MPAIEVREVSIYLNLFLVFQHDMKRAAITAAQYPKMVSLFLNILHTLLKAKLIWTYDSFRNRLISGVHFLCHIRLWPRQNIITKIGTARVSVHTRRPSPIRVVPGFCR